MFALAGGFVFFVKGGLSALEIRLKIMVKNYV
jgi:hypothetical protein